MVAAGGEQPRRILLLIHYYLPNTQSCAALFHDLAVELRDRGHEIIVAAPEPTLDVPVRIVRESGLTVVRARSGAFQGVSRPRRAYNEWRLPGIFWRRAGDFFRDNPCEHIISMSPTIFFAPLVARLKRVWGCNSYLVLRDVFPQWIVDRGLIRANGPAHRLLRHHERRLYRHADFIGLQSPHDFDHFAAGGPATEVERQNVELLYNWAATTGRSVRETAFRDQLDLGDKVVFLYGGNLGAAQGAMSLIRTAESVRDDRRIHFLIVGDGTEATQLIAEGRRRGLDNVHFLPPVPHAEYLGMVSEVDVGLISLDRKLTTNNHPLKMFDYMYFGKPILAALNPGNDLRHLLETREAGLVCWNGEETVLAEHARRLADDPALRRRFGVNSRALLERVFSVGHAADRILSRLRATTEP